jgi:hypothetical protein
MQALERDEDRIGDGARGADGERFAASEALRDRRTREARPRDEEGAWIVAVDVEERVDDLRGAAHGDGPHVDDERVGLRARGAGDRSREQRERRAADERLDAMDRFVRVAIEDTEDSKLRGDDVARRESKRIAHRTLPARSHARDAATDGAS